MLFSYYRTCIDIYAEVTIKTFSRQNAEAGSPSAVVALVVAKDRLRKQGEQANEDSKTKPL